MASAATTPAIEVTDLVIRYGASTAVDRVSFVVNEGEQLTLLGPSGCGKTSTLRAVAGLERPHAGTIRIAGRTAYDGAHRIDLPADQRGLSMVFQ
ncbi:MAG: ATP-binding cassette domain-containing protein, partial [Bradyrhizobiaceae bacterium]|nr:ATP-binding cassette domain-containing protein [Bradyrhizobiaceae bacterium]